MNQLQGLKGMLINSAIVNTNFSASKQPNKAKSALLGVGALCLSLLSSCDDIAAKFNSNQTDDTDTELVHGHNLTPLQKDIYESGKAIMREQGKAGHIPMYPDEILRFHSDLDVDPASLLTQFATSPNDNQTSVELHRFYKNVVFPHLEQETRTGQEDSYDAFLVTEQSVSVTDLVGLIKIFNPELSQRNVMRRLVKLNPALFLSNDDLEITENNGNTKITASTDDIEATVDEYLAVEDEKILNPPYSINLGNLFSPKSSENLMPPTMVFNAGGREFEYVSTISGVKYRNVNKGEALDELIPVNLLKATSSSPYPINDFASINYDVLPRGLEQLNLPKYMLTNMSHYYSRYPVGSITRPISIFNNNLAYIRQMLPGSSPVVHYVYAYQQTHEAPYNPTAQNNSLGIKETRPGRGTPRVTTEVVNGREVEQVEYFRDFASDRESVNYWYDLWGKQLEDYPNTQEGLVRGVYRAWQGRNGRGAYATDPLYGGKGIDYFYEAGLIGENSSLPVN
jgi:hypothetical protein